VTDLGDDDGHREVLGVCSDVAEHHDSRQTHVTARVGDIVHHCSHAAGVHYQLSQLHTDTQADTHTLTAA